VARSRRPLAVLPGASRSSTATACSYRRPTTWSASRVDGGNAGRVSVDQWDGRRARRTTVPRSEPAVGWQGRWRSSGPVPSPGAITVTANRGRAAPGGFATVHAVDQTVDRTGRQLVGLDPVYPRVPLGRVSSGFRRRGTGGVRGTAASARWGVQWTGLPAEARPAGPGVYPVEGTVRPTQLRARGRGNRVRHRPMWRHTPLAVPVGTAPGLPATVRLGAHRRGRRAGNGRLGTRSHPASLRPRPGQFTGDRIGPPVTRIRRRGAHPGHGTRSPRDANLALDTGPAKPKADASYAGSPSTPAVRRCSTAGPTTGGWSNAFNQGRPPRLLPCPSGGAESRRLGSRVEWGQPAGGFGPRSGCVLHPPAPAARLPASIQVNDVGRQAARAGGSNPAVVWGEPGSKRGHHAHLRPGHHDPGSGLAMTSPAPETGLPVRCRSPAWEVVGPAVVYNGHRPH